MAKTAVWGETLKVNLDVGFISNAFKLDSSLLDNANAVLDGTTEFVDITEYVQNITINRGRTNQVDTFNAGTLALVADDRASGRSFDPLNTASPWYEGDLGIAPRRAIEVYGGSAGTAAMFKGYIYDLNIEYDEPQLSSAQILAVDALAQLAQTNLVGFNPSSQLTSERVSAILSRNEVSWSTALREINSGLATVGTVAYEDNANVLEALQALQISENGRFYASRDGMLVFDPRIQVSFGTAVAVLGGTATTDVPIRSLNNLYGAETVLNRISVQVEGSSVLSVVNGTASQAEYGIKNFALNNLPLVNDAAGSALAVALLSRYQTPEVVFNETSVLLNGLSSAQQELMASLEIGDILAVEKRFAVGTPSVVRQNVVVESIRHQIAPSRHEVFLGLGQVQLVLPFIVGGYTTTTTRTNLVTNPNFEVDLSTWSTSGTVARTTAQFYSGVASASLTYAGSGTVLIQQSTRSSVTTGLTYTASFYLKQSVDAGSVVCNFMWYNAAGSVILDDSHQSNNANTAWQRFSQTRTAPTNAASCSFRIYQTAGEGGGAVATVNYVDTVLIEQASSALPYFDGTYADTYTGYTLTSQGWSGTANASTSTATWGLTSTFIGSPLDDTDFAVA